MDTRLKKFKYSIFTKFVCWALAVLVISSALFIGVRGVCNALIVGVDNYFNNRYVDFFDTELFQSKFYNDFYNVYSLARYNREAYNEQVENQREKIVDQVYESFLDSKAAMIKAELQYAVNNWDATYYEYEDSVNYAEYTEPSEDYYHVDIPPASFEGTTVKADSSQVETTLENTTLVTSVSDFVEEENTTTVASTEEPALENFEFKDNTAPKNVKMAEYALATCEGREIFEYFYLVREEAYDSCVSANCSIVVPSGKDYSEYSFTLNIPFRYNEDNARDFIESLYDEETARFYEEDLDYEYLTDYLYDYKNMKFYVVSRDGTVFSNIKKIPGNISEKTHCVLISDKNSVLKGFDFLKADFESVKSDDYEMCIYFDDEFKEVDEYRKLNELYNTFRKAEFRVDIVCVLLLLAIGVALLICWLFILGKKSNSNDVKLYFIDKIPNDIHFILSFGLMITFAVTVLYLYVDDFDLFPNGITEQVFCWSFYAIVVCMCLLTEWIGSVVRAKKAGESFFKRTVVYMLFSRIFKLTSKMVKVFTYKPRVFKIQAIFLFVGFIIVNLVLFVLAFGIFTPVWPLFVPFILLYNSFVGFCFVRYVNNLDKIIIASGNKDEAEFKNINKLDSSLKILSENLNTKNSQLDIAVAEAVKKEQMKTQLITNVSHDLKTPLTSLINYSDLLSKCNIDDEEAKKYVETINLQSIKMKRLIEDLIEATKVSTGNVTLNKIKLNLSELSVQAIVEFTPAFDENKIEIKFTEPDNAPFVFADSTKTYRILSNLFSNARKYSAPGTRVYVDVYSKDGFGYFEIKNISKEPLNISADLLTERFVRGDESRANEGNGLGLSIAKDLCLLQNGTLDIIIDGDLFKVIVKLPNNE